MLSFKSNIKLCFPILGMFFFVGCSTEKDAALNIGYHNMTARYNGYYNARDIMNETLENYRAAANEDYTKILPLDLYPPKEDIPLIQEKYELAFEKCENVIYRHSMPSSQTRNKGEEHCRWIDDNWFVIGQIHYTRMEYVKAIEILKFVQETPLYVDQERVYEARIWLAKCYIAQGRYPDAKRVLANVRVNMESTQNAKIPQKDGGTKPTASDKKKQRAQDKKDKKNGVKKPAPFPDHLLDDYELTMAEFYLAQEDYKQAIPHLEKGIALTKKRKQKARYQFVLAQLYAKMGDGNQAAFYFNKVAQSNAPYEMRFQAHINKAISATSGGEEIRKELTKMLKDPKNLEFKDQIYFALAEMEMKDGNKDLAISNYSKSAFYSVKNDRQKGISYLKLGDIYFNDEDYLKAQKYYDSCVQVLPEEYETYEQVKAKAEGLSDLVMHYEIYVFEDSVQQKAKMSPEELDKYLEQQLEDILKAEKKRKEDEERRLVEQQNRVKNTAGNSGTGSKWYFYNQKVSASGFNDFRALWGQRVEEDDWRRSNKTSYSNINSDDPDNQDSMDVVVEVDLLTIDMLKANIPLTAEALDSSNNRLMKSLYMLGIIYKEQLKEDKEAIKYFKKIVAHGVEHPKVLPAMFQLYLLYKKQGSSESEVFKARILAEYPGSEIADILLDPEYLIKKQEREKQELNAYSKTLEDYRYQRYSSVILQCNDVLANQKENQYINKYYLLKAFSIAKTSSGNDALVKEPLLELYQLSPTSEEGQQAKIYLDKLEAGTSIIKPDSTKVNIPVSPYLVDDAAEHFFVLIFPNSSGRTNATEVKLSNFNKEFFRSKQLKTISTPMGENQLIVVRTFPALEEAINYRRTFKSEPARPTIGKMATEFEYFLISQANFSTLIGKNDLQSYLEFYKEKYPQ